MRIALDETIPDHSTISRTRRLIDVETHQAVFQWVLRVLAERNLLKGNTIGVDATTLEANAALRSIVRRDTGEQYKEFLTRLAQDSGIQTPTREQLARLDRKRKKKGSNALLSRYNSNRLSWLGGVSAGSSVSTPSKACKMGIFSNKVTLKICRIL